MAGFGRYSWVGLIGVTVGASPVLAQTPAGNAAAPAAAWEHTCVQSNWTTPEELAMKLDEYAKGRWELLGFAKPSVLCFRRPPQKEALTQRLDKLEDLYRKKLIPKEEYDRRRALILQGESGAEGRPATPGSPIER